MSDMSTSATRRLATSAHKIMKEAAETELADTIANLSAQLADTEAQSQIDELIVVLSGFNPATERLNAAISWVFSNYENDDGDEEVGPTRVVLNPSSDDRSKE